MKIIMISSALMILLQMSFHNCFSIENNDLYSYSHKLTYICEVTDKNWSCDPTAISSDGVFRFPTGIATDNSGNVFVADSWNDRIQKFSSNGTFLGKWGSTGSGDGQFLFPTGIATDNSGNVFVVDFSNDRIQKFSSNGTFLGKWGSTGSGDGQFQRPYYIAIDKKNDFIYVSDFSNSRIQKFSSNGTFLGKWGIRGSGDGQFGTGDGTFYTGPAGIATDNSGNVFVADFSNSRIQKFSSNGTFLGKWGSTGSGDGQFLFPTGIATDNYGNVFVADSWNDRIQVFSEGGAYKNMIESMQLPDGRNTLEDIFDLKIENGTMIVSDSRSDSLEFYTLNATNK